jgi:hypothetical protein
MEKKDFFEWASNEDIRKKKEIEKEKFLLKATDNIQIKTPDEFHFALERFNTLLLNEASSIKSNEFLALEKAIEDFWPNIYPRE